MTSTFACDPATTLTVTGQAPAGVATVDFDGQQVSNPSTATLTATTSGGRLTVSSSAGGVSYFWSTSDGACQESKG